MPSTLRLRPARVADLPALLALEASFPGDRMSARQFRHHLASPRARWQVAEEGGRLLGYGLVLLRRGTTRGRLYSIVVAPEARGRGLGRRLLAAAEQDAAEAGCAAMSLEVRQDNLPANALYLDQGYRRVAALPGYYDDGGNGWRYTRDLPGSGARIPR